MIQPAPSGKKTVEIRIPHMPVPQRNWPYRVSLMQSFKQIKKKMNSPYTNGFSD